MENGQNNAGKKNALDLIGAWETAMNESLEQAFADIKTVKDTMARMRDTLNQARKNCREVVEILGKFNNDDSVGESNLQKNWESQLAIWAARTVAIETLVMQCEVLSLSVITNTTCMKRTHKIHQELSDAFTIPSKG